MYCYVKYYPIFRTYKVTMHIIEISPYGDNFDRLVKQEVLK